MIKISKIFYWIFVIFLIYIIIELIRKILGGSLGFEELVSVLLVANLGYTFYIHSKILQINLSTNAKISEINSKLSEHIGWHKGKEHNSK